MIDPIETEKEIQAFWDKNRIYEESKKKNAKGKKFYFMDGPPYATGYIHLGTALNKILKDISMRSQRLQGKNVFDRPGYDTHGVPIEFQVEKEIGSRGKQDIEAFGVDKFVTRCKDFATRYIGVMNQEFKNLGVWMDWENPYLTLSEEYIEAIWHAFKEADKKGLLILGKYPIHVCTRCATAVAYNEIEYGKQKDNSIYVKFPLNNKENTSLVIWTTTPWTLPANTGVMVHPDVVYQEIVVAEGEHWIMAKDLVPSLMTAFERSFSVHAEFKGKKMEGWTYKAPLADKVAFSVKNGHRVVLAPRYVTTTEGTGLVHCAPGHGKEDYDVGREYGLDSPSPVGIDGLFKKEAGEYAGMPARESNDRIIEDLQRAGLLIHKKLYEHDYPLCWRDKTPLLMISQPQWFLKISDIHKKLLSENNKNTWNPDWAKLRMKAWLEGISDWPVSRQRYWGTPLPIWYDEETGERVVVGSMAELQKLSGKKKIDLHKPGIDSVTIKTKSGKTLHRVKEVLDVWFDSGVSSWAALGYPKNKAAFKKFWPADLNIEGKDQIRGWWNSQLILSTIAFGCKPFDAISMHGMVLDVGKRKMSKSLGNIVSPGDIIARHGRDVLRYYFAKISKGDDFGFDEKELADVKKVFMTLYNINTFVDQIDKGKSKTSIEDKWIMSQYNKMLQSVQKDYNEFKFFDAVQKIESFLINDLSRTYIQIIRERSNEVYNTLHEIRCGLLQLIAPIAPFITEKIWQDLRNRGVVKEKSIHLTIWPKPETKKIDAKNAALFDNALKIIEKGLAERDKLKIGLRWPLASVSIQGCSFSDESGEVIARQLNVKKVRKKEGKEFSVELDTKITPELEAEGYSREVARKIQAERKNAGLQKGDMVKISVFSDNEILKMLQQHNQFLKERINASSLLFSDGEIPAQAIVFTVKERKIGLLFS